MNTTATDGLVTELPGTHHDRTAFSCGAPELDRYLKKQASQDTKRYIAAPFVICEPGSSRVLGYYTLSAATAALDELPATIARKLPHYPDVPAFLLGRLAVDSARRGQGLGKRLLVDALRRCWEQKAEVAAALVIVEARDETAAHFYEHFGFTGFPDHPGRLFLPIQTIAELFRWQVTDG